MVGFSGVWVGRTSHTTRFTHHARQFSGRGALGIRIHQITSDLASVHGYVFEPEIFTELAALKPGRGGEVWLTDAVNALAQRAPVYAYRFEGERFDTGDRAGYVRAVVAAALERPELAEDLRSWLAKRLAR